MSHFTPNLLFSAVLIARTKRCFWQRRFLSQGSSEKTWACRPDWHFENTSDLDMYVFCEEQVHETMHHMWFQGRWWEMELNSSEVWWMQRYTWWLRTYKLFKTFHSVVSNAKDPHWFIALAMCMVVWFAALARMKTCLHQHEQSSKILLSATLRTPICWIIIMLWESNMFES